MFGPQARAAELQAVRSAAMRQKSRETEEQMPTSAAISLTDFARGHAISKNKGSKQYKPLNLEDLDDSLDEDPATGTESTSSNLELHANRSVSAEPSPASTGIDRPAPTAPKAMLDPLSRPSSTKRPQPNPRDQPRTSPHDMPGAIDWTPTATNEEVVYQAVNHEGPYLPWRRPFPSADFIFGLNGYSPAKPELQLEQLRSHRYYGANNNTMLNMHLEHPYMQPTHDQTYHGLSLPFPRSGAIFSSQRSYNLEQFERPTTYGDSYLQPRFERSSTFANDILHHENKLNEVRREITQPVEIPYDRNSKMQSFVAAQQAIARTGKTVLRNPELQTPTPGSHDSPSISVEPLPSTDNKTPQSLHHDSSQIDRSQRLTDSVPRSMTNATAKATPSSIKSGSNRDPFSSGFTPQPRPVELRHRVRSVEEQTSLLAGSSGRRRRPEECLAIWRALQKRNAQQPADLAHPADRIMYSLTSVTEGPSIVSDAWAESIPIKERGGSDAWCSLHPVGPKDRELVKRVFTHLASKSDKLDHDSILKRQSSVLGDDARAWMQRSTINETELDVGDNQIPREHMTARSSPTALKICKASSSKVETKAYGDIATEAAQSLPNSKSYQEHTSECHIDPEPARTPEHEADGIVSMGLPPPTMMFQLDGHAAVSPPQRLARDPRYRPLPAGQGD